MELTPLDASENERYKKIAIDIDKVDDFFVQIFCRLIALPLVELC